MFLLTSLLLTATCPRAVDAWPQWGGPTRDFRLPTASLADEWPETGLRTLWDRQLGNGKAGIVAADSALYTVFGTGREETVVALDAGTGSPRWRYSYPVGYEAHRDDFGGPHATPLITAALLITVSIDAQVHAFDRSSGELRWRRDLVADHDLDLPQSGYAASPLAWGDTVILPGLGGRSPGAIALSAETGETRWARHAFLSSHASPILLECGGREHVVFHGMNFLVGLDPGSGGLLWRIRLRTGAMDNVAFSPLWDAERSLILVSHTYDRVGTRALRLAAAGDGFTAEEVWTSRRLKVEHSNGVVLGGVLYGSDGSSPALLVGIDLESGECLFKQRGFGKSTLLAAGDRLLMLDEEGVLRLARPIGTGVEVLTEQRILRPNAWTAPALVGSVLMARDRFRIMALELP